jgi:deoxyribose-phosphate aldolase
MDTYECIAKLIDHGLLNPTLTDEELEQGCLMARESNVSSVCIKPYFLKRCTEILRGSSVKPSTVIGFPHGSNSLAIKRAEAKQAYEDGCQEYDIVINIGKALSEDWNCVQTEIQALTEYVHEKNGCIKVIFENAHLKEKHKIKLCEICAACSVDYTKTSTGFAGSGATLEDVRLMIKSLPPTVKVKASGGILTLNQLLEYKNAGVSRIGTSRTNDILKDFKDRHSA